METNKETQAERQLGYWTKWQQTGDEKYRTKLLADLKPLIKHNISQYSQSTLPYEVIELEATAMAKDALGNYNPTKAGLGTYVTNSIKPISRFVQGHQNVKYLPSHLAREFGRYEAAERAFRNKEGREPTEEEMAKKMGLTPRQIKRIALAKAPEFSTSVLEGDDIDPNSIRNLNKDKMYYLRSSLSGKEKKVFDYLTGMGRYKPTNRKEISKKLNIPMSEIYTMTRQWSRSLKR